MSDKPNTTTLPDGWRLFDKYQIRHTDGIPLKGKRYFVLRLDTDDPAEAARVAAAMSAYKGETQGNAAKLREALKQASELNDLWFDTFTLPDGATSIHDEIEDVISAALAAPPRNCDVGTAEEQYERYKKLCSRACLSCPVHKEFDFRKALRWSCQLIWAQLPYECEAAK